MTSDFAQRLKEWRTERGVAQTALAQYLGISRQALNNWESGRGTIAKSHRRLVAYALRYYDIEHGKGLGEVAQRLRKIADQIDDRAA